MLFDEDVAAILRQHFVCVLTDAPWSKVAQRNAATWDEVEGWKSAPRNSEIVFVVSADKRDRRGLVYSYLEPAELAEFLRDLLREDGKVEVPEAERDRLIVLNRMRAKTTVLRRALHDELGAKARPALSAFDRFAAGASDDDLCPAERMARTRKAILADEAGTRARLEQTVTRLLERASKARPDDDPVLLAIRTAWRTREADLCDVPGLLLAEALLRKRLESE